MAKSIREIIKEIQNEIQTTADLMPERAAELLNKLASLYGNCNDRIREKDIVYNQVLLLALDGEKTANRAKIKAETSEAYKEMREARDTKELVKQLIGSLK